jgi:hypothetical protein
MAVYIQLTTSEWGPITHYRLDSWKFDLLQKRVDLELSRCYPAGNTITKSDRPPVKFKIEGSEFAALMAIPVAYPSQSFLTDAIWIISNFLVNKKYVNGKAVNV